MRRESSRVVSVAPVVVGSSGEPPGVIYRHAVEAFVERVLVRRGLLTTQFVRELSQLGLDIDQPREMNLKTWTKLLRATAVQLSPGKNIDDALEDVGREMLRGFAESLVGRPLFLLLRVLGPRKAMLRMPENYQLADSVTRVTARSLAPRSVELVFNTTGGVPTHIRGIALEVLERLGAQAPVVTFEERADATVFIVSWASERASTA